MTCIPKSKDRKVTIYVLLQEKDAESMFGMLLYSLYRLYHSVKRHAEDSGEWQWLVLVSLSSLYHGCLVSVSVEWIYIYVHLLFQHVKKA